jgi:pimeloyl-ACP methyl ester carboxylesterase
MKIIIIVLIVLLVLNIADFIFSVVIYKQNFDQRFTTPEPVSHIEEFEELAATKYTFPSDKGQLLTGYMYRYPELNEHERPHGIVIIAHGFGCGGHNTYMSVADHFAGKNYLVFAYDATACDESEGDGVGGLPQGVIDLDTAISFVEKEYPDMPVVLFGHSWGGYSVMSVLKYHPEIKAAVECSGFAAASDMFEIEGKRQAGYAIYAMLPYVKLYDRLKFGKYAKYGALDGLSASDTPVMVIHSADDDIVPIEYGYDKIYEKYSDDPRFEFVRFDDRGHNNVFVDKEKLAAINDDFKEWIYSQGYDPEAAENRDRYYKDRETYYTSILNRDVWNSRLNFELLDKITEFYENQLTD